MHHLENRILCYTTLDSTGVRTIPVEAVWLAHSGLVIVQPDNLSSGSASQYSGLLNLQRRWPNCSRQQRRQQRQARQGESIKDWLISCCIILEFYWPLFKTSFSPRIYKQLVHHLHVVCPAGWRCSRLPSHNTRNSLSKMTDNLSDADKVSCFSGVIWPW